METIFNIMIFCIAAYIFFNYVFVWLIQSLIILTALVMYVVKAIYSSFKKKIGKVSK
jgi:hypothetical protein